MEKSKQEKKLSKKELERLAEALKKTGKIETKKEKKIEDVDEENKFVEAKISLEKISPVLKPVAKAPERLEQRASSFLLQKRQEKDEDNEKPYEFEKQKYFSQSGEYKTIDRIQTENLQTSTGVEKSMSHMGVEQSQKRKSERFFDDKSEQKYSADFKPLEEIKKREKKMYTSR